MTKKKSEYKSANRKRKEIIGNAYVQLKERVEQYAEKDLNVLFVGARGTGKELFLVHYKNNSKRTGAKRTLNCAAVSDELIDSEVFGHVKGAFTGAEKKRKGLLSSCDDGILCLDEFGDASERFQAAILRIAQGDSYRPVGSDEEITDYDTVIVASTNKPNNIRQDLKDRFHIFHIPPLQPIDIPRLAEYFCDGGPLEKGIMDKIISQKYPGNIRQLRKECEKLQAKYGEKMFVKRRQYELYESWVLDYERYERELALWNKYILPVIRKLSLQHYRYKYEFNPVEFDPKEVGLQFDPDEFDPMYELEPDQITPEELGLDPPKKEEYVPPLDKFFNDYLNHNLELDVLAGGGPIEKMKIIEILETCYKKNMLSSFLNILHDKASQNPSVQAPPLDSEISLSLDNFLKIRDKNLAVKEFTKVYFRYHIKRAKTQEEAANSIGMKISAFRAAKSRLKI